MKDDKALQVDLIDALKDISAALSGCKDSLGGIAKILRKATEQEEKQRGFRPPSVIPLVKEPSEKEPSVKNLPTID